MQKIQVKICMGTTCFVMGASNLQDVVDMVNRKYKDIIEASYSPCLGLCSKSSKYSKAPYVIIDETIISEATPDKVLSEIERRVNDGCQ